MPLLMQGELVKANASADMKSFYLEFYHTTTREGREIGEFLSVALEKEHMPLAPYYIGMVNKQLTVPVKAIPTKRGTIFYVTTGNGKPLELEG